MENEEQKPLLEINNLKIHFTTELGTVKAINNVNLEVYPGQSLGIAGESGCGKSVTVQSILSLLPPSGEIKSGEIIYRDKNGNTQDIAKMDPNGERIRQIRGGEISMVFQEPMTAFSPVHTMSNQIMENILLHEDITKTQARERVVELFRRVGISNPEQRIDEYSFNFSGGMRQRAMIAMALACNPRVLIADEPTTALDVTIQAQVLNLIKKMQQDFNLTLILITHDLGVISHMSNYLYVMYLGYVVEEGKTRELFENPSHPYTRDMIKSIPKVQGTEGKLASIEGSVPDSYTLPSGCPFHPRCRDYLGDICKNRVPEMTEIEAPHRAACFKYIDYEVKNNV